MSEYVLGLSAYYHDSAAALLKDGVIVAACQEERLSRKKHDSGFPTKAVNLWRATNDEEHMQLVAIYFAAAGAWRDITIKDRSPKPALSLSKTGDPLYAVRARAIPGPARDNA